MITIGGTYMYDGRVVTVDDGDRIEGVWVVTVKESGRQVAGVSTSELKDIPRDPRKG